MADELLGTPLSGVESDMVRYLLQHGSSSLQLDFDCPGGYWEIATLDEVVRQASPSLALSSLLRPNADTYTLDKVSGELLDTVDLVVGNLTGGPLNSKVSILIDNSNGFPLFMLKIKGDNGIANGNLSTSLYGAIKDLMPLLYSPDEPAVLSPLADQRKEFFRGFFDRADIKSFSIDQQIGFFLSAIESDYEFDFRIWLISNGYLFMNEIDEKLHSRLIMRNYENVKAYARIIGELQGRFYGLIPNQAAILILMACIMRYEYVLQMQEDGSGIEEEDAYNALVSQATDLSGGVVGPRVPSEIINSLRAEK